MTFFLFHRTVTEITAPAPLSSVALLTDGSTLVGGGADGKNEFMCVYCTCTGTCMYGVHVYTCMYNYIFTYCNVFIQIDTTAPQVVSTVE